MTTRRIDTANRRHIQRARLLHATRDMKTIGLIGAGHIGSQLARLAVAHGYDVVVSNSRQPETLSPLIEELGPHARAATPTQAAEAGDIVVVTIPLKNVGSVPIAPLTGKIV
ncbi:MAG TPA: NAD(P)-binding domain-containing protein, partial [Vicinamibacterales bacterium]|nr:NAD(P)-binding domain-containing protein [Vicinamibacterales bacterium]